MSAAPRALFGRAIPDCTPFILRSTYLHKVVLPLYPVAATGYMDITTFDLATLEKPETGMRRKTLDQRIRERRRALSHHILMPTDLQGLIMLSYVETGTVTPKCAHLLRDILRQTRDEKGYWVFDGSVTTTALVTGCTPPHAKVCIKKLVDTGILKPILARKGKPKLYLVQEANTELVT